MVNNYFASFLFVYFKNYLKIEISNEWNNLTSRTLWSQISEEAGAQYHFEIKL